MAHRSEVIDLGDDQQDLADFLEDQAQDIENQENQPDDGEQAPPSDDQILAALGADDKKGADAAAKAKRTVRPQPKLNEAKLVNPDTGLPVLPKIFENWKPNSKLDEYQKLDQVMNKIEHWAHCLYPKMKFDDFIQRVEHLGHKRAVKTCVQRIRLDMPLTDEDFESKPDGNENEPESQAHNPDDDFVVQDGFSDNDDDWIMGDAQTEGAHAEAEPETSAVATTQSDSQSTSTVLTEEQRNLIEEKRRHALELRQKRLTYYDKSETVESASQPATNDVSTMEATNDEDIEEQVDPDLLAQVDAEML